MSIERKEISEISWADIEGLIAEGASETGMLEFKSALSAPKGAVDPWMRGEDAVGNRARNTIAHEVTAFANAYGGTLLLGIDEDRSTPRRAVAIAPIQRCEELAERLGAALRSPLIDPPILSLEVRAIPKPGGAGEGVVVFRVSSSTIAPHGVDTPPSCYVRRGTECRPMQMSDIRSMFWEARTTSERSQQTRQRLIERHVERVQLFEKWGVSASADFEFIPSTTKGAWFRCSAIPQRSLPIGPLQCKKRWLQELCPTADEIGANSAPAVARAGEHFGWLPKAHGVVSQPEAGCLWTAEDDGTISVSAFSRGGLDLHYPGWYVVTAAQVMTMAERLRLRTGRPDVAFEIDLQIARYRVSTYLPRYPHKVEPTESSSRIGPFAWSVRDDLAIVFREVEREIWNSFSSQAVHAEPIDFEEALKPRHWAGEN